MQKRSSKVKKDINETAFAVVQQSTGGAQKPEKNPAAVALGHLGGLKGGKARANKLTKEQRVAIAKRAAQSRWQSKS